MTIAGFNIAASNARDCLKFKKKKEERINIQIPSHCMLSHKMRVAQSKHSKQQNKKEQKYFEMSSHNEVHSRWVKSIK